MSYEKYGMDGWRRWGFGMDVRHIPGDIQSREFLDGHLPDVTWYEDKFNNVQIPSYPT
jgi:hypothetical protein